MKKVNTNDQEQTTEKIQQFSQEVDEDAGNIYEDKGYEKSPQTPKTNDSTNEITNLTPDQAIEMLNCTKLKLIVYILINLIYNFNTIFVAAIPFLIQDPIFLCEDPTTQAYYECKKETACSAGTTYKIDYDNSYDNLLTALNLECKDGLEISLMTMFAFGANWAGSFIFNVLGDKYGRLLISKIGFILACSLYLFYLLPIILPLALIYMLLFGFLNAYFLQTYILGVEFTSSSNRDFYTIVAQSFDGLMGSFTVVIFSLTKHYRVFTLSGFVFGVLIMIGMFMFVPESPRYYVARNQNKKAVKVYKYLASLHPDQKVKDKIDRLEQSVNEGIALQDDEQDTTPFKEQLRYFFKTRTRIVQAVIISLCWFVNCLQNYGLNLELGKLEGDIIINSAISNVTGFVACFMSYPILLYAKRKPAQIMGFTLTMLASCAYNFAGSIALQYFLLFCIKFGISLTFILIYCFTAELYPTEIRGLAFGLANTFGRLATVMSALMVAVDSSVFMWMNVGECILIILCTFILPETKGMTLMDKIEEQIEQNIDQADGHLKLQTSEDGNNIDDDENKTLQRESLIGKD